MIDAGEVSVIGLIITRLAGVVCACVQQIIRYAGMYGWGQMIAQVVR